MRIEINFIILAFLTFATACSMSEMDFYIIYPSLSEAKDDKAIERGWIPNWIPEQATQIHEAHNLDTNIRAISLTLPEAQTFVSMLNCRDTNQPMRPRKVTKLFPEKIHLKNGVKDCGDLFIFAENDERIHIWAN